MDSCLLWNLGVCWKTVLNKKQKMKHLIPEALPLATIKQRAIIQSILRFPKPSEKQKYLLNSILSDILKNKETYRISR